MIYLRDTMTPPQGGWRYPSMGKSRETDLGAPSHLALLAQVDRHYRANGEEPPGNDTVNKWLCDNFPLPCLQDGQVYDNPWTRMEPTPYHLRPIPYPEWPLWAKMMKKTLGKPEDRGIGGTVERLIGPDNSEKFKAWYRVTFNVECGCQGRKDRLNANYPYTEVDSEA